MTGEDLPGDNARVIVRSGPGKPRSFAWVEMRADSQLVLSPPELPRRDGAGLVRAKPPDVGTSVVLCWRDRAHYYEVAATVVDRNAASGAWRAEVAAEPSRVQRRRYVRARVEVGIRARVDGVDATAIAVDISEGGLRCELLEDVPVRVGALVDVELDLDGEDVVGRGEVLRIAAGVLHTYEFAMSFTSLPPGGARRIRRYAFARQVNTAER